MRILVLGAGRMGYGAVYDLVRNSPGVASVTVADFDLKKAQDAAQKVGTNRIEPRQIDASDHSAVVDLMSGHDSVISCVNYWHNVSLSKAAIKTRTNFCDLGGNNTIVDEQLALDSAAKAAGINIIPDCGLAPGMVSILAMHGARHFEEELDEIHIRVGGLPQNPKPPLDYQLVFSVEGLINEYVEPARVIRNGRVTEVESMTELESLSFEGFPPLEAFQTSGGTSTLPDTFFGKIRHLDYKTIRYAGHCEKFKTMIDLGLCSSEKITVGSGQWAVDSGQRTMDSGSSPTQAETRAVASVHHLSEPGAVATGFTKIAPRQLFASLLQKHLPADEPDYVLVRIDFVGKGCRSPHEVRAYPITDSHRVSGPHLNKGSSESKIQNLKSKILRYDIIDRFDPATGLSAMMRTTAFPASIIAQMMARGDVPVKGTTPQEKAIDPEKFIAELARRSINIKTVWS